MEQDRLPWSYYAIIISFGIFFFSLNVYILTKWLSHPFASELWLIGIIGGLSILLYSVWMLRKHQKQLIEAKQIEES
jgi:hypothetical protein